MDQLRSLTIKASEPKRLADFYRAVFELDTFSEEPDLIRLSDGLFVLALLKEDDEALTGHHASGFQVESLETIKQKAETGGALSPHGDFQVVDPDKNLIDVAFASLQTSPMRRHFPFSLSPEHRPLIPSLIGCPARGLRSLTIK